MNNLLMSIEYTFIVLNRAVLDFEEVNFNNGIVPNALTKLCILTEKADKLAKFNINKFMQRDIIDIKKAYYNFDLKSIEEDENTSQVMTMTKTCKNESDLQEYRDYSKMFFVIRQKILYLKKTQSKRIKTSKYKEIFKEILICYDELENIYMKEVFYKVS